MAFYDKWIDNTIRRLGYIKQQDVSSRSAVFAGEAPISITDLHQNWTDEELDRLAFETPWLFSNIDVIMSIFSEAQFQVMRKSGETLTPVVDHEFERLLTRPSTIPYIDASFLWSFTAGWGVIRREAYWLLNRDATGRLAEIVPIPVNHIQPIPSETDYISGFLYNPGMGKKPQKLPRERVLYWRRPNLFNYHRGFKLSTVFRLPAESDHEAAVWNRETFLKGLTLQQILFLPEDLSDPLFEQAKKDLTNAVYEDKKRFLAMRAGEAKAETVGADHQKAQFVEGRHLNRDEIDRITGFPGGFWSEKANRANSETAVETVISRAIWPMMVSLASAITTQILIPYYGDDLVGQFRDIRPEDRADTREQQKHEWTLKTLNEARDDIGDKPMPGEMGELLGDMPVSLATNPQFVQFLLQQKDMKENPPAPAPPQNGEVDQLAGWEEAARKDLRRWRSVALRRVRDGQDPGDYEFKSEFIPSWIVDDINLMLSGQTDEQEIKALFEGHLAYIKAVTFVPAGNDETILPVEDVVISDDDVDRAVLAWDRAQGKKPNLVGLLTEVEDGSE